MHRRNFLLCTSVFFSNSSFASLIKIKRDILFKEGEGLYYSSFFDRSNENSIVLSFSQNGRDWTSPKKILIDSKPVKYRDPSIAYFRGGWLIAITNGIENVCDFKIIRSSDLTNWTVNNVKLDSSQTIFNKSISTINGSTPTNNIWAPNLYIDKKDNLYVFISIVSSLDNNFSLGEKKLKFDVFISKLIDLNELSFAKPKKIRLFNNGEIDQFSRIDPCVIFDDSKNKYILSVKRENFGCIDFFESSEIYGDYNLISTLDFYKTFGYIHIEGPAVLRIGSLWYVFFDSYYDGSGIGYCCTKDFINFTSPEFHVFGKHIRHGSLGSTDSSDAIKDARFFINGN